MAAWPVAGASEHPRDKRKLLQQVTSRLSAGAELGQEVTLSSEECDLLIRWIRNERYRHPRRR